MPYTTEDGGRMNNFANEPRVYQAEPATNAEKRNYAIIAIVGVILVGALIGVAFFASNG